MNLCFSEENKNDKVFNCATSDSAFIVNVVGRNYADLLGESRKLAKHSRQMRHVCPPLNST